MILNRHQDITKKGQITDNKLKGKTSKRASLSAFGVALSNGLLWKPSYDYLEHIMDKIVTTKQLALVLILHTYMYEMGLETQASLGNYLVCMFVEAGSIHDARKVFDLLSDRQECNWNALIAAYLEYGESRQAFYLYKKMKENSLCPGGHAIVCLIQACAKHKDLKTGSGIYADIIQQEGLLLFDVYVGSALVDMFVKCGAFSKANEVFDKLPLRNVISWNALIAGYAKHEQGEAALKSLELMHLEGLTPNEVTYICCLKACGNIGAIEKGCQIHGEILEWDLLNKHHVLGSALVDMYAKCGALLNAQEVFDNLDARNVNLWNALIGGYLQHECGKEALLCFKQMQSEGVLPDYITYTSSLKACSSIKDIEKGSEIHAQIDKQGFLQNDPILVCALVDMYAKFGMLEEALELTQKLAARDVFVWTALIAGYIEQELSEEALACFERMRIEGISPDAITCACCLKACGSIGAISKGREIHAEIERRALLQNHLNIGNAIVDMYTKFGLLTRAAEEFDRLSKRDIVTWNTLISGYTNYERGEEVLLYLERMKQECVTPDAVTCTCCLKACASIVAIEKGRKIHSQVEKGGLLERDVAVGNALIDMYVKCGFLRRARELFNSVPNRTLASWNMLISGYAKLCDSDAACKVFDRMQDACTKLDSATFAHVLQACNHDGLPEKAEAYFYCMILSCGIIPTAEHFTCIVDLLGRAGQLDKSIAMTMELPYLPDVATWYTILCACQRWGNVELGKQAFYQALCLDETQPMLYISMSNIY